jgi:hypothetical protein
MDLRSPERRSSSSRHCKLISSLTCCTSYINFAHGDEDLEDIYGESLPRLRELKKKWDPENRFNQWFPIV